MIIIVLQTASLHLSIQELLVNPIDRARGWKLEVEDDRGGISFPNFLPRTGKIPVLDGLGPIGGGMHTREEDVLLRSFARRIVLLTDLLEANAGHRKA